MDIVDSKSNLMRSPHPTQILGSLISSGVRETGNVPALSAEAESARNANTQNSVFQFRRLINTLYADRLRRDLHRRRSPEVRRPNHRCTGRTHQGGADQIGVV